jgi:hypothetical protein
MMNDGRNPNEENPQPGRAGATEQRPPPPPPTPQAPQPVPVWNPARERPAGGDEPVPRPEVPLGPGAPEVPESPSPSPQTPPPLVS